MKPVWIVDDDQSIRWVLEKALTRENIPHKSFSNPNDVLDALPVSGRLVQILLNVTLRVDDRGLFVRADIVRSVGKTFEVVLLEDHGFLRLRSLRASFARW